MDMPQDGLDIDRIYTIRGAGAVKVERPLPDYRLVRKNGTLALQRAYEWNNGNSGGVDWEDEPTIDLDQPESDF